MVNLIIDGNQNDFEMLLSQHLHGYIQTCLDDIKSNWADEAKKEQRIEWTNGNGNADIENKQEVRYRYLKSINETKTRIYKGREKNIRKQQNNDRN